MKLPITFGALLLGSTAVFVGQMNSDAVAARNSTAGGSAPDVIIGDIQEIIRHGDSGGITAYSIGTDRKSVV